MPRIRLSLALDRQVRQDAQNRCGYCLSPQHLVMARLEIEHIIPISRGGSNHILNLWLACSLCNGHKRDQVEAIDPVSKKLFPLFNPRLQNWFEHFKWNKDGLSIIGITPIGRSTVMALQLDSDPDALIVRSYWVMAGWHPPTK